MVLTIMILNSFNKVCQVELSGGDPYCLFAFSMSKIWYAIVQRKAFGNHSTKVNDIFLNSFVSNSNIYEFALNMWVINFF